MPLVQLLGSDGSYDRMKESWQQQCEAAGEDFSLYAQGTFIVLDQLAAVPERRSGIFALERADVEAICQVNCTPLPGHPEPVLRVRMVTMSPNLDFGVLPVDRYIDNLVDLFFGIVEISQEHENAFLRAQELKIHLRSPQDYDLFRAARPTLARFSGFKSVEMKGAWLYVTCTD